MKSNPLDLAAANLEAKSAQSDRIVAFFASFGTPSGYAYLLL
jgi:hypothetical protein